MASIRKLSRDRGKKNRPYFIRYFGHEGKRVTVKGSTDKGLTEQLAAKLENEIMLRRRGMIDPEQERLLSIKQLPVRDHFATFERSLDNTTPKHQWLTMTRVRRLVEASGTKTLADSPPGAARDSWCHAHVFVGMCRGSGAAVGRMPTKTWVWHPSPWMAGGWGKRPGTRW